MHFVMLHHTAANTILYCFIFGVCVVVFLMLFKYRCVLKPEYYLYQLPNYFNAIQTKCYNYTKKSE